MGSVTLHGYVDGLLNSKAQVDTLHSDQLEDGLLRLEGVALIPVCLCADHVCRVVWIAR